ncbi:hypothetical protein DICPUDRAFT_74587 [Dictyostelium purpureum]|uniref:J domain-containing protein n=1 Tax=Dictyostelium purpureum TaxID=5786 RepID=F0Z864_DICPU|nr:uncharacterized protein DICPUDRAFT_74587 [Dictyostelium purpureum]EGC39876.1 hypothetical protein DICPUDRAFT_74587 [Dictyostelium purpureum]|eukprot:XP_003283627.1 hypothetical protein DICPUDRAFT_74587 [Dictyostelium purpureum]
MECNKDDALKARNLGESYYKEKNYSKALSLLAKSKRLYPTDGIDQLISTVEDCLANDDSSLNNNDSNINNSPNNNNINTDEKSSDNNKNNSNSNNNNSNNNNNTINNQLYTKEQIEITKRIIESKTHYEKLSLTASCTEIEIKKKYRHLAKLLHPDKNSAPQAHIAFQEIKLAHDVLSDPILKRKYDDQLRTQQFIQKQQQQRQQQQNYFNPFQNPDFYKRGSKPSPSSQHQKQHQKNQQPRIIECLNSKTCPIITLSSAIYDSYLNCQISILCRCNKESAYVKCKSCSSVYHLSDNYKSIKSELQCQGAGCKQKVSCGFPDKMYSVELSNIFIREEPKVQSPKRSPSQQTHSQSSSQFFYQSQQPLHHQHYFSSQFQSQPYYSQSQKSSPPRPLHQKKNENNLNSNYREPFVQDSDDEEDIDQKERLERAAERERTEKELIEKENERLEKLKEIEKKKKQRMNNYETFDEIEEAKKKILEEKLEATEKPNKQKFIIPTINRLSRASIGAVILNNSNNNNDDIKNNSSSQDNEEPPVELYPPLPVFSKSVELKEPDEKKSKYIHTDISSFFKKDDQKIEKSPPPPPPTNKPKVILAPTVPVKQKSPPPQRKQSLETDQQNSKYVQVPEPPKDFNFQFNKSKKKEEFDLFEEDLDESPSSWLSQAPTHNPNKKEEPIEQKTSISKSQKDSNNDNNNIGNGSSQLNRGDSDLSNGLPNSNLYSYSFVGFGTEDYFTFGGEDYYQDSYEYNTSDQKQPNGSNVATGSNNNNNNNNNNSNKNNNNSKISNSNSNNNNQNQNNVSKSSSSGPVKKSFNFEVYDESDLEDEEDEGRGIMESVNIKKRPSIENKDKRSSKKLIHSPIQQGNKMDIRLYATK